MEHIDEPSETTGVDRAETPHDTTPVDHINASSETTTVDRATHTANTVDLNDEEVATSVVTECAARACMMDCEGSVTGGGEGKKR